MTRARLFVLVSAFALLAVAVLALPAAAETYTVKLKGGGTFLSRHQPQQASWDESMILVLSDVGNWLALSRQDVESIVSDTNNRGFGKRLDANTIVLGWSANDYDESTAGAADLPAPERSYDQNQFVDPEDIGGGFPTTFPGSYSGSGTPAQPQLLPPPAPVTPPAGEGAPIQ